MHVHQQGMSLTHLTVHSNLLALMTCISCLTRLLCRQTPINWLLVLTISMCVSGIDACSQQVCIHASGRIVRCMPFQGRLLCSLLRCDSWCSI